MNKVSYKKASKYFSIFFILCPFIILAQSWNLKLESKVELRTFKLTNKVEIKEDPLVLALITLYKGTSVVNQMQSDVKGQFAIDVPANGDFILVVSYPGCNSKKFAISTMAVPSNIVSDKYAPVISIEGVVMAKGFVGVNYSILQQPLVKIGYIEKGKKFGHDESYTNQMLGGLEKIWNDENDLLERFTSLNNAGDIALSKGNCPLAKSNYEKAMTIIAGEKYPANQLLKVGDCLKGIESQVNKVAAEKLAQEKAIAEKLAQEKATAEKLAQEKAAAEKLAQEKVAAEKQAQEKAKAEKLAQEKAKAEKLAQEKAAAEKLAQEKAIAEKLAQEKATAEKLAQEKAAAEKLAQEKATAEKLAQEKAIAEKQAQEKAIAEKLAQEKAAAEKLAQEKVASEKQAQEKAIAEKLAQEKATTEKLAQEKAAEKLAQEKVASEKQAQEKAIAEKLAQEKVTAEKLTQEKAAAEKLSLEKVSSEKQAQEKAIAEKLAQEKATTEKLAQEKAAAEKLAQEKATAEKLVKEKAALEKLAQEKAQEKATAEKLVKEKAASEKLAKEKALAEKQAQEKATAEKLVKEKVLTETKVNPDNKNVIVPVSSNNEKSVDKIGSNEAKYSISQPLGEDKYKELIKRGDELFKMRRYTEAKLVYEDALSKKPGDLYSTKKLAELVKLIQK